VEDRCSREATKDYGETSLRSYLIALEEVGLVEWGHWKKPNGAYGGIWIDLRTPNASRRRDSNPRPPLYEFCESGGRRIPMALQSRSSFAQIASELGISGPISGPSFSTKSPEAAIVRDSRSAASC
jgi:hypothetical protein